MHVNELFDSIYYLFIDGNKIDLESFSLGTHKRNHHFECDENSSKTRDKMKKRKIFNDETPINLLVYSVST